MLLEFVLDAVAGTVVAAVVLVALDAWLRLGLTPRQVLLSISLAGLAVALLIRMFPRLRAATLDDLSLAMTLDRIRPGIGQQAADVLQLPELLGQPRSSESPALVLLAVRRERGPGRRRSRNALELGPDGGTGADPPRRAARAGCLHNDRPGAARLSLARWLKGSNERWPQGTYLSVNGVGDGNRLLAPRDEPFTLEVRADLPDLRPLGDRWLVPGRGEPFEIRKRPESAVIPPSVRLRERTAEGTVLDAVMTSVGPGVFRHELPPSSGSSTFELVGGDDWLGPIRVERVDRPTLQAAKLRVRDPARPRASSARSRTPASRSSFCPIPRSSSPWSGPSRSTEPAWTFIPLAPWRWTASTPGLSPPAGHSARRRPWRSSSPRAGPGSTRSRRFSRLACSRIASRA